MPAVTAESQTGISVVLSIPFDAQWSSFEVWASRKVREADVPKFMALVTSDFPNADFGDGTAKKTVTFEDLKMENSRQIFVKVLGVKASGEKESLYDVASTKITRSNSVTLDVLTTLTEYPAEPQVPLGFDATEIHAVHVQGARGYISFDGIADHGTVVGGSTIAELQVEWGPGGAKRYNHAKRVFIRADTSSGTTVRITAKRPDAEQL